MLVRMAEDRAGTEGDDARAAVDDRVSRDAPEADPLFVALLDPGHFDLGQGAGCC